MKAFTLVMAVVAFLFFRLTTVTSMNAEYDVTGTGNGTSDSAAVSKPPAFIVVYFY
jgi:hypothetical protein